MEPTNEVAPATLDSQAAEGATTPVKVTKRQPCPCGSGKKFKACCIGDPAYELVVEIGQPAATPPAVLPQAGKGSRMPKVFNKHQPKSVQSQRQSNSAHHRRV